MKDQVKQGERLVKWRWIYRVLFIFQVLCWAAFLTIIIMRFTNPSEQVDNIGFYIGAVFCILAPICSIVKWRYDYLTKANRKRLAKEIQAEGI